MERQAIYRNLTKNYFESALKTVIFAILSLTVLLAPEALYCAEKNPAEAVERPEITIFLMEGDHIPFSSLYKYEDENFVYVDVNYLAAKLGGEYLGVREGEFKFQIRELTVVGKIGSDELYLRGRLEGPNHTTVFVCDKIHIKHRMRYYKGRLLAPLNAIADLFRARVGTVAGLADEGCGRTAPIIIPVPKPPPPPVVKKTRKKHDTRKDYKPFVEKYPMYLTINCDFSPQEVLTLDELKPFEPVTVMIPEGSALMVMGSLEERR